MPEHSQGVCWVCAEHGGPVSGSPCPNCGHTDFKCYKCGHKGMPDEFTLGPFVLVCADTAACEQRQFAECEHA